MTGEGTRVTTWELEKHTPSCQYFGRLHNFHFSVPCWNFWGKWSCTHLLTTFSVPFQRTMGAWGQLLTPQGWSGPGKMNGVGPMKAKHGFSFERMSFVVVRSPWLWGSHKASNSFCALLKRIQSFFFPQIWIECVCLKNYFLCKSCSECEMIGLSNCPSKETQA